MGSLSKSLCQRSSTAILPIETLTGILYRDVLQRSYQEMLFRDLVQRSLAETYHKDLGEGNQGLLLRL